jgi:hypothetical protein
VPVCETVVLPGVLSGDDVRIQNPNFTSDSVGNYSTWQLLIQKIS